MTILSPVSMQKHCKKGFTLTEIAIVLGIIGLILGAVWTAASGVYASTNASNFSQSVANYVAAMRSACNGSCQGAAGNPLPTIATAIPSTSAYSADTAITTSPTATTDGNGNIVLTYMLSPTSVDKASQAIFSGLVAAANVVGGTLSPVGVTAPSNSPTCANSKWSCQAVTGFNATPTGTQTCTGTTKGSSGSETCSYVTNQVATAGTSYALTVSPSF